MNIDINDKDLFDFRPGEVVHHTSFGRGVILSISGTGDKTYAKVKFFQVGVKVLSLQWAPLSKADLNYGASLTKARPCKPHYIEMGDSLKRAEAFLTEIRKSNRIRYSNFSGYQISVDIDKPHAIAYAIRYGLKHLQELRSSLRSVFVESGVVSPPSGSVDVLEIGCGPGMSRLVLPEFGISARSYSGIDHAENCVWLAKQFNNDLSTFGLKKVGGIFTTKLEDIQSSSCKGFVIINHVLNQSSIDNSVLTHWVKQLNRIFPLGFQIFSIEPKHRDFEKKLVDLENHLFASRTKVENLVSVSSQGEFKAQKTVTYWRCGG